MEVIQHEKMNVYGGAMEPFHGENDLSVSRTHRDLTPCVPARTGPLCCPSRLRLILLQSHTPQDGKNVAFH